VLRKPAVRRAVQTARTSVQRSDRLQTEQRSRSRHPASNGFAVRIEPEFRGLGQAQRSRLHTGPELGTPTGTRPVALRCAGACAASRTMRTRCGRRPLMCLEQASVVSWASSSCVRTIATATRAGKRAKPEVGSWAGAGDTRSTRIASSLSGFGGRGDCRLREDSFSTSRRQVGSRSRIGGLWAAQSDLQRGQPKSDRLPGRTSSIGAVCAALMTSCIEPVACLAGAVDRCRPRVPSRHLPDTTACGNVIPITLLCRDTRPVCRFLLRLMRRARPARGAIRANDRGEGQQGQAGARGGICRAVAVRHPGLRQP
jgi:hypothetical protein